MPNQPTPPINPEWVSIDDAATLLSVSPDTIRRMLSRGELTAHRIGPRLLRINVESIRNPGKPLAVVSAR